MNNQKPKTILLVEDESLIALAEAKKINNFGYNVINAYSGEQAVQIVTSNENIDLVLMDIGLDEDMDGTIAAKKILAKKEVPIVFLTAHIEEEYVSKVNAVSRYGYILKNSGDHVLRSSIEMVFELIESRQKIKENEKRFRIIFEQAPLGVALIDSLSGHIYEVNSKFASITGRTREEIKKINWMSITHPDDIQKDLDNMKLLNAGAINGFNMQKRYIRPGGTVVWINMTIAPLFEDDETRRRHLCMIEDITGRREIEIKLEERTERLKNHVKELKCLYGISSLLEIPGASLEDILQGVVNLIPSACQYSDKTCARIIFFGQSYYSEKFKETGCSITDYILLQNKKAGEIDIFLCDDSLNCKEGKYLFLSEERTLLDLITERIGAIAERFLLKKELLDISEQERIKIGQDLHDGVGQDLTGLGYLFGALADKLAANKIPGKDEIEAIMKLIDDTKKHVRRLSLGLSPVNATSSGVISAVKELCCKAENIFNINCKFTYDKLDIEDNIKATHVFYIIQEALTNAVKHGKAKNVLIYLKRENGQVKISVEDDGIGIQYKPAAQNGFGMELMKYRGDIIGGRIGIAKNEPAGTIVSCLISLDNFKKER